MSERTIMSTVVCPKCSHSNPATNEFCRECGASLQCDCPSCLRRVSLAERFCGSCGTNLQAFREKEERQVEERFAKIDALEAEFRFADAILMCRSLQRLEPQKYASAIERAGKRFAELSQAKSLSEAAVSRAGAIARQAIKSGDYAKVVSALQDLHENQLEDELKDLLNQATVKATRIRRLREAVQAQLKTNPIAAFPELAELAALVPADEKIRGVGEQLRDRLLKGAAAKRKEGGFAEAARLLAAIPEAFRDANVGRLHDECEEVLWLEKHLKESPFVDESLVSGAELYVKRVGETPRATKWLQDAKQRLAERKGRADGMAPWVASGRPVFGKQLHWFQPLEGLGIEGLKIPGGPAAASRFAVAIGLALQALEQGEIEGALGVKESKGLVSRLSLLGKKKPTNGWGLDLGTTGLRAAKLVLKGTEVTVAELHAIDYRKENPVRTDAEHREAARGALAKLKDETTISKSEPCVVSLDARHSLYRFVNLPAGDEAKFQQMVELEAKHQIPYGLEQVYWYWHRFATAANGMRALMIVAARRTDVDDVMTMLEQLGIKASGVQCEPIALLQLLRRRNDERSGDSTSVLIDFGAANTHLVVSAGKQAWVRSISVGGQRITSAIARERQLANGAAEALKLAPFSAPQPLATFRAMSGPLGEWLVELDRSLRAATQAGLEISDADVWLSGGSSRLHGLGRVLMRGIEEFV